MKWSTPKQMKVHPGAPTVIYAPYIPLTYTPKLSKKKLEKQNKSTYNKNMTDNKLDFWIKNNYNVLFEGKHGVGKTARIIDAFERAKLKWRYFSASTLDPWVDFVGVPKEVTDADGSTYIDLIRPKCFADDEIQAIFLDEYNRSQPKVRNATMELVQFKSINGRKFNNLKIIWVAVNPDSDGEDAGEVRYDVEKLDPAQRDRFHVQVIVPYKPDLSFFRRRFESGLGESAVSWWNELEAKEKDLVSPRRLEYAVQMYIDGGDVRDVLPQKINVSKLITELKCGSYRKRLDEVMKTDDMEQAKLFIADENNYNSTFKYICEDPKRISIFFPFIPEEKQVILTTNNLAVQNFVFNDYNTYKTVIAGASTNKNVQKRLASHILEMARNSPMDISKLTFKNLAGKVNKPRSAYLGYTSNNVTSLLASYGAYIVKGTTYRRQLFESLTVTLVDNYIKKSVGLTVSEAENVSNCLCDMIESTSDYTAMSGFSGFDNVFSYVHNCLFEYKKDNITPRQSKKVNEYIKANLAKFI